MVLLLQLACWDLQLVKEPVLRMLPVHKLKAVECKRKANLFKIGHTVAKSATFIKYKGDKP